MKKSERLELMKELVRTRDIETQQELIGLLNQYDINLTQATISRDMNEIGIIKVPSTSGRYIYGISPDAEKETEVVLEPTVSPILKVLGAKENAPQFLAVEVVPGNSRILKRRLKETFAEELISVIADDDSLLLVIANLSAKETIEQHLNDWMKDF